MVDLSVLIPARNEDFLNLTIQDVLAHSEADTEIIVVLDGAWPKEPIKDDPRVVVVHFSESIGQRAATNVAARISQAKYVMKLDAHCSMGQGFDRIMLEDMAGHDDWVMVPKMYNLHVFDWVCPNGHRRYQGPSGPCAQCGEPTVRDIVWKAKTNPESTAMRFDRDLKFQYWREYKDRQHGDLVDTMSILGACWLVARDTYFEWNICDELHGNWGQQGTEVACKAWLSGGRLVCNKRTSFAHMFRTQGQDFGFPYPLSGKDVRHARNYSQELWNADNPDEMPRWDKAVHPLSWLIDKFSPVPGWDVPETEEDPAASRPLEPDEVSKAIVYYTDCRLDPDIMRACQSQLLKSGLPVVCVSLKPIEGFAHNVVVDGERSPLTMFRQILAGLEAVDADVVFLAEHDVLYHPSHFEFMPERSDLFYYNNNVWRVDAKTGRALFHYSNHTSQLCAYRDLMLAHYRRRVEMVEQAGFSRRMGFEPGTHGRDERVDDFKCATWMSPVPNIDLRHRYNLTQTRWNKSQFRNKRYTKGWTEADEVPGWGRTKGNMDALLRGGMVNGLDAS